MAAKAYNLERGSVQWKFQQSRAKLQVFGGGYGNGKTTALVIKALKIARAYPGINMLLARSTYPKLNDTLRRVFLMWIPEAWVKRYPTKDDNTLYMINGSVVNFRYIAQRGKTAHDGFTTSNLLSAEYGFIGVDQAEDPEISEKDIEDLFGRLREQTAYRPPSGEDEDDTMPSDGPRWMVLTCNPTHNWLFKKIVQPYIIWRDRGVKTANLMVDEAGVPIIDLFEGPTTDNASNLPVDYIATQSSILKGAMRQRFFEGKWAAYEGLVYPTFEDTNNKLPRALMEQYLMDCLERDVIVKVREGYDFGLTSPTCYGFSFIDDMGRVFLLDGFYEPNLDYREHPSRIFEIRAKYPMLDVTEPVYADPSIFRRQVISPAQGVSITANTTVAKLLADLQLKTKPASNDVVSGIAKVTAYINPTPELEHVVTGMRPGSRLYVCEDLEWFFNEVNDYYWKKNPQGQNVDEPVDNNDHAMDMLKYMLSKLPHPSEIVINPTKLPPAWMRWHEIETPARR